MGTRIGYLCSKQAKRRFSEFAAYASNRDYASAREHGLDVRRSEINSELSGVKLSFITIFHLLRMKHTVSRGSRFSPKHKFRRMRWNNISGLS
jgi:outer membrane receptor for Fe3+-dicitrate